MFFGRELWVASAAVNWEGLTIPNAYLTWDSFEWRDEEVLSPAARLDRTDVFSTLRNPMNNAEDKSLFVSATWPQRSRAC